ncbi:hypothetical protein [Duganella margarita]|uniref:hypothetical protein n=1 Tax=Duganella margarita TaxID=2692170 RepID=UPI003531141B
MELIDDSVGKAHAGARLVDQAGVTMDEIADSVTRAGGFCGPVLGFYDATAHGKMCGFGSVVLIPHLPHCQSPHTAGVRV